MRTQYSLTPDAPTRVINISFVCDSLIVMNYTPYVLYLIIGSNRTAGPMQYDVYVPAGTTANIPCKDQYFYATLNVSSPPGRTTTLTTRCDLTFCYAEVAPIFSQLNLAVQGGVVVDVPLLVTNANFLLVIDAKQFEATAFNLYAQNADLNLFLAQSIDGVTWNRIQAYWLNVPTGFDTLTAIHFNQLGYIRANLVNIGANLTIAPRLTYNLLHTVPDALSYRMEIPQSISGGVFTTQPSGSQTLVIDKAMTAILRELQVVANGVYNPSLNVPMQLSIDVKSYTSENILHKQFIPYQEWRYGSGMQTVVWTVDLDYINVYNRFTLTYTIDNVGGNVANSQYLFAFDNVR